MFEDNVEQTRRLCTKPMTECRLRDEGAPPPREETRRMRLATGSYFLKIGSCSKVLASGELIAMLAAEK